MNVVQAPAASAGEDRAEPDAEMLACEAGNEQLRREIQEIDRQLQELGDPPEETNDALKRIAALERELASVEASLASLHAPVPPPASADLRKLEEARTQVVDTAEELEKAFAWETERKEDEEAALERDKSLFADATSLHAALSTRAAAAAASFSPRSTGDTLVLRAQGLVSHLSRRSQALRRALLGIASAPSAAAFDLGTWLRSDPTLSSAATANGGASPTAAGGVRDRQENRAFQLKKLLEALMNRSLLSDSYPPELVTFLVRAQVAVAHPTAEGKVRLVDFGGLAP
ncbi:Proteophosphoglycan ppg4 [Rhodotorula diobovata]|uniref:Proteophosphoglycan ppg4 n=1 Tax=Rhodotorula diobovata TaxID=5288 RepID=A0A5C5FPY5_9BASI|nr:Proteophosphoglycan ppg4 [Rhodotorula diobovata]